MPVLGLGGEYSYGPEMVPMLQEFAVNVSGGIIPGCAHWLPEEKSEEVTDRLLRFLAGQPQP